MASKKKKGLGRTLQDILDSSKESKAFDRLLEGAYRYDEREKARIDREFDIYDTPRSRKAIEYLEGEERRAAEEREEEDRRKREEEAKEDVVPEKEEEISLPIPEYVDFIEQAIGFGLKPVKRPDLDPSFYSEGPDRSTRVHAMQYIATSIPSVSFDSGETALGISDLIQSTSSSNGDILVAFARPSKGKSSLFIYKNKPYVQWLALKNGSSLGRYVKALGSAEPYSSSMGAYYKDLHKNTMDGGSPYDNWIFNEDQLARWMVIRPDNER